MKIVSLVSAGFLLLVGLVAFVLLWSPGAGSHRVKSTGGRMVLATVHDAGWSWDFGADFYVDLYLIEKSGAKKRIWKDGNGQQSIDGAKFLKRSIRWIGEREIRFSSHCTEEHYAIVEDDTGEWNVTESWWKNE